VALRSGDPRKARRYFEQAADLTRAVARAQPHDPQAQVDLAAGYNDLGNVLLELGDVGAARANYRRVLRVAGTVRAAPRYDEPARMHLAVGYFNLGKAERQAGRLAKARDNFTRAVSYLRPLAATSSQRVRAKRRLVDTYWELGDIALYSRDPRLAQRHFAKAREVCEELCQSPGRPQRDLAQALAKLGEACERLDDIRTAHGYYVEAHARLKKMWEASRQDFSTRYDLAMACRKLGGTCLRLSDVAAARRWFGEALDRLQKLAADHPDHVGARAEGAVACGNCAWVEMYVKDFARAAPYLGRGVAILEDLTARGKIKNQPRYKEWLTLQRAQLTTCRKAERALQDLEFAAAQPHQEAAQLLLLRATVLANRGSHAEAARTAERLRGLAPKDKDVLYDVACCYGLCAAGVAAGKKPDQLTTEESAARRRYTARAVETLTEAVRRGYRDVQHCQTDPDLAAVRGDKRYQELVKSLTPAR
jgi:tetratricopeptide (TPR) repeat protein